MTAPNARSGHEVRGSRMTVSSRGRTGPSVRSVSPADEGRQSGVALPAGLGTDGPPLTALLGLAVAATLADVLLFVARVVPGDAVERNPVVAGLDPAYAIGARVALLVLLMALTLVASRVHSRVLRGVVGGCLVTATISGAIGAIATVTA